jgi:hypothetical protein
VSTFRSNILLTPCRQRQQVVPKRRYHSTKHKATFQETAVVTHNTNDLHTLECSHLVRVNKIDKNHVPAWLTRLLHICDFPVSDLHRDIVYRERVIVMLLSLSTKTIRSQATFASFQIRSQSVGTLPDLCSRYIPAAKVKVELCASGNCTHIRSTHTQHVPADT